MRYASWDQPFQFQPSLRAPQDITLFSSLLFFTTMLFVFWMVMWFGMIILYSGWHILCFELCIWHFRQHLRKNLFAFLIRCFVFFMIYLFLDGIFFRWPICPEPRPQATCSNFIGLKKPPILTQSWIWRLLFSKIVCSVVYLVDWKVDLPCCR